MQNRTNSTSVENVSQDNVNEVCGRISITQGDFGIGYVVYNVDNEKQDILIQSDWGFPPLAANFGWVPCCGSGRTDGTIDCPDCGATIGDLICAASQYLDENEGKIVEDPGYFETN